MNGALVNVADIHPGPAGSDPKHLVAIGGTVFFAADDGTTGSELWRSDGTPFGTARVVDLDPGPGSTSPRDLSVIGDTLYFGVPQRVLPLNRPQNTYDLWKTLGTEQSTVLVEDLDAQFAEVVPTNGRLTLFTLKLTEFPTIDLTVSVAGLYTTEGRPGTAELLKGWQRNVTVGGPATGTCCPGRGATVGPHWLFAVLNELWSTDGTRPGTAIVRMLDGGGVVGLVTTGGAAFFLQEHFGAGQLWRSDGSTVGTVPIVSTEGFPFEIMAAGRTLFFTSQLFLPSTGRDCVLARSDGTASGTTVIRRFSECTTRLLATVGGTLFFQLIAQLAPPGLWASDGTDAGTVHLADGFPNGAAVVNGTLYYAPAVDGAPTDIWKSDGTRQGTVRVAGLRCRGCSVSSELTAADGTIFLVADDAEKGPELWALLASCGDGRLNPAEECDDGNTTAGDGCDPQCRSECRSLGAAKGMRCELAALRHTRACRKHLRLRIARTANRVRGLVIRALRSSDDALLRRADGLLSAIETRGAALFSRGRLSADCTEALRQRVRRARWRLAELPR